MPSSLQLLTNLGFPGVARMIRAGRIGRKGAIDQVWHAYKVRDVEREGAVAASDAIRAYFVQKDARAKARARANPPGRSQEMVERMIAQGVDPAWARKHWGPVEAPTPFAHRPLTPAEVWAQGADYATERAFARSEERVPRGTRKNPHEIVLGPWERLPYHRVPVVDPAYSAERWGRRQVLGNGMPALPGGMIEVVQRHDDSGWHIHWANDSFGGNLTGYHHTQTMREAFEDADKWAKSHGMLLTGGAPKRNGSAPKRRSLVARRAWTNSAVSRVKIQPDVYGSIIVSDDKHVAIIHPAQKFLTVFGQYIEGHFTPDRMKKSRTYLTLAAAQRSAARYVEQARGARRNPYRYKPPTPAGLVHLQYVGDVPGKPVESLKPGDRIMWNGGAMSTVVEVRPKSASTVVLVEQSDKSAATYERVKRKGTLIAFVGASKAKRNPATTKPKKPRKVKPRTAYQAQAYHFDAASWDRDRVTRWLNRYGHNSANVQLVGGEYVAPQFESWDYETRTLHRVQVAKHVEATVGVPLAGSDAASAPGYNKRFGQVGLFPKGKRAPEKAAPVIVDGIDWTSDDSPF